MEQIQEFGYGCFLDCNNLIKESNEIKTILKDYVNTVLQQHEKKQIEEWTTCQCSNILFDSDYDYWEHEASEFTLRVENKKRIVILIETEEGNKFGYYINNKIKCRINTLNPSNNIADNKSFEFKLYSEENVFDPVKYETDIPIKYNIFDYSSDYLMEIDDIVIMKSNINLNEFKTYQNDIITCLKPKKIIVIQMELTEKQKEEKQLFKYQKDIQRQKNYQLLKTERINQLIQLEEWTHLKCNELVFDSNIDDWSIHSSVFNKRIIGKKQLVFLIVDEENEIFGYYLNTQIENQYYETFFKATDFKSFEFNLQSNNNRLYKPMKFEIQEPAYGYYLTDQSNNLLISLGDINIFKLDKKYSSSCIQRSYAFNYHEINNALCGKSKYEENCEWKGENFTPKRILVIQMK